MALPIWRSIPIAPNMALPIWRSSPDRASSRRAALCKLRAAHRLPHARLLEDDAQAGHLPVAVSKGRQQALTKALTSSCRTSFSATSPATTRNYSVATRTCEWLARVSTAARTSTGTTRCGRTCRSRSRSASARRSSCSMRCSSRRRQKRAAARAPPRRRPWPPQPMVEGHIELTHLPLLPPLSAQPRRADRMFQVL